MTEELRVDTGLVRDAGGRLQEIAAGLPQPPSVHRPTGTDALSAAIAAKVTEVVDPVAAQMPVVRQALSRYAQNVIRAAGTYDAADRQIADDIRKRVGEFDEAFGGGTGMSSGDASTTAGAATGTPIWTGGVSPVAAAAQQGGQFGSLMQVPMQAASQAGAVPQTLQHGAEQAMQQVGQLTELAGEEESNFQMPAQPATSEGAESPEAAAAPGDHTGERAPEVPAKSPERIRPAETGSEIAL